MAWDTNKTETELFEENEHLVKQLAKQFSYKTKVEYEDLYQEGAIALLRVIRLFLSQNGETIKFPMQYAKIRITTSIKRYILYQEPSLHVSRRKQIAVYRQNDAKEKEAIEHAKSITLLEAYVLEAIESQSLGESCSVDVEDEALFGQQIREILDTINRLPESKRKILREYFSNGMDVKLTAEALGCSVMTVYRARAFLREKVRYLKIFDKDAD